MRTNNGLGQGFYLCTSEWLPGTKYQEEVVAREEAEEVLVEHLHLVVTKTEEMGFMIKHGLRLRNYLLLHNSGNGDQSGILEDCE